MGTRAIWSFPNKDRSEVTFVYKQFDNYARGAANHLARMGDHIDCEFDPESIEVLSRPNRYLLPFLKGCKDQLTQGLGFPSTDAFVVRQGRPFGDVDYFYVIEHDGYLWGYEYPQWRKDGLDPVAGSQLWIREPSMSPYYRGDYHAFVKRYDRRSYRNWKETTEFGVPDEVQHTRKTLDDMPKGASIAHSAWIALEGDPDLLTLKD